MSCSDSILNNNFVSSSSSTVSVPSTTTTEEEEEEGKNKSSLTNINSSSVERLKQYTNILIYLKDATTTNKISPNDEKIFKESTISNQIRNTYIEIKYKECLNDLEKAKLGLINNNNNSMNSSEIKDKMVKNSNIVDVSPNKDKLSELDADKLEVKGIGVAGNLILVSDQQHPQRQSPLNLLSINDVINSCYSNSKNKTENATISTSSSLELIEKNENETSKNVELKLNDSENKNTFTFNNDQKDDQLDYESKLEHHLDDLIIVESTDMLIENEGFKRVINGGSKLLLLSILYSLSEPNINYFNGHVTSGNNNDYVYFEAINKTLNSQKNNQLLKSLLKNKNVQRANTSQQHPPPNSKINVLKKNFDIIDSILKKYDYCCPNSSSAMHNYFCKRLKLISKENLNLSNIDLSDQFTNTLTSSTSFNSYESIQLIKKSSSCSNLSASNNKNFDNFLSNIMKGKQKSTLLYNQQLQIEQQQEEVVAPAEVIPAEEVLPIEKVEIKEKEEVKENYNENINNNDIDIPDEIRGALVSAGIDISQIINLKNEIEMKIKVNDGSIRTSDKNEDKLVEHKSTQEQSKVRKFEIKQDKSSKITQTLEKEDGKVILIPNQKDSVEDLSKKSSLKSPLFFSNIHEREEQATVTKAASPSLSSVQSPSKGIIPAKEISLFKPMVIHKHRTLTMPTSINLSSLITSSSTDSFNDLASENTKLKSIVSSYSIDEIRSSNKTLDNKNDEILAINDVDTFKMPSSLGSGLGLPTSISHMENISFLSLNDQLKKKPSVTRSFSYNISKFINGNNSAISDKKANSNAAKSSEIAENNVKNLNSNKLTNQSLKPVSTPISSTNGTNLKSSLKTNQNNNLKKGTIPTTLPSPIISDLPLAGSSSSLIKFSTIEENKNSLDNIYHVSRIL